MASDPAIPNGAPPKDSAKKPSMDPNVLEVVFGSLLIKPWFPSFYPEELVGRKVERLYVCQWCFKYTKELVPFLGHLVSRTELSHAQIYSLWVGGGRVEREREREIGLLIQAC